MELFEIQSKYQGKETLSSLRLYFGGHQKCQEGHSFGPAVRKHYLIHFVEQGFGTFQSGDTEYRVGPGNAFLIYPGISTYYQADEKEPWDYRWIAFDGSEVSYLLGKCGFTKEYPIFSGMCSQELFQQMEWLTTHLDDGAVNEFLLLSSFLSVFSHLYQEQGSDHYQPADEYFSKALEYLHHNYEYPIQLSKLSAYIGIDRTYLYRIFKDKQGCSPQEYLVNLRLNACKQQLRNTSRSMTEIALSNGFHDASAFSHAFYKQNEMSPMQYRKCIKNEKI